MVLHTGKSKTVHQGADENTVILRFTDNITAGNGEKHETMQGKGELCAAISNLIFAHLKLNGVETHLVEILDETSVLAKKAEIVGVEVIVRNAAAGGFVKKYGVAHGLIFEPPVVEFCVKSDKLGDPMANENQIAALGIATPDELSEMTKKSLLINTYMCRLFKKAGIRLADFKLEFGRYENKLILCDEISPDSCRLWDMKTGEKFDKDIFRQGLGDVLDGYREVFRRLSDVK
ncbi:MAG: phosphoribosylaminoimidazolesuccinocarboxamide synthase [Defluviitaleaceae bacterium]|nr:phosphoribosylaminoimidazolesuccinocarboxamide synthase [Defluviitaleaceae bacterium]MCL2263919.1 phosphoribosylaminoimidazolesuccinocarboxamide synthase [Defluviitaleaceae bacterium]